VGGEEAEEARTLLRDKIALMERLTWDELDAYGEQLEEVTLSTGTRLRVRSTTYWDMEPWQSDLHIVAEATPVAGRIRRVRPYREHTIRGGEQLPS
jgi:hypothetical protein